MADLPNVPIKKRSLDEKIILSLDGERERLAITGLLDIEYDNEAHTVVRERPGTVLREGEYTAALDELLPEIADEPWEHPRAEFMGKLLEILKRTLV